MNNNKFADLAKKWNEKLRSYGQNPEIAKNMDARTALGVQHGRTSVLLDCIKELENIIKSGLGDEETSKDIRTFADVHDSHCCKKHGCKYNSQDCTVESGLNQGIKCEMCEFDDEHRQKICAEYDLIERGTLVEYLKSYIKKIQDSQCYEGTYVTVTISNILEFIKTL